MSEIDDLLVREGARWRADQPPPPEPDLHRLTARSTRHRRTLTVTLAAASATAIAFGAVALFGAGPGGTRPAPPGPSAAQAISRLVVADGDRVQVTSWVLAIPGKSVIMCAGTWDGDIRGIDTCPPPTLRVTLQGLDVAHAPLDQHYGNRRAGELKIVGTWDAEAHAIAVESAERPESRSFPPPTYQMPCPAPEGGWPTRQVIDSTALQHYVRAHPEWFAGVRTVNPDGSPAHDPILLPTGRVVVLDPPKRAPGTTPPRQAGNDHVLVVEVAHGDLDAIKGELARLYPANLCVEQVRFSTLDVNRAYGAVVRLLGPKVHATTLGQRVDLYVPFIDQSLYRQLVELDQRYGGDILRLTADIAHPGL
jgi:hypothetical protein